MAHLNLCNHWFVREDVMKKIALMGAGAVGAYFIQGLCDLMGDDFFLIADGSRKERLEKNGVNINDMVYKPIVKTPKEARGVDYLLIATKYTALESCLDDIETIVTDKTTVLSLLNGVDSEEVIAERIGKEHIIYSFMKIASMNVDGKIKFDLNVTKGIYLGEIGTKEISDREKALIDIFEMTNIKYVHCEDIILEMWKKYALNICRNLPQAVVAVGVGAYDDSEHLAYICEMMREEVHSVAQAKGIPLIVQDYLPARVKTEDAARYSTLQDLDAGRHTEIDIFSGRLVEMGKELGIPTPFNDMCYHLIKTLEEKNDGKFNY